MTDMLNALINIENTKPAFRYAFRKGHVVAARGPEGSRSAFAFRKHSNGLLQFERWLLQDDTFDKDSQPVPPNLTQRVLAVLN